MKSPDHHVSTTLAGAAAFLAMAILGWNLVGGSAVSVAEKSGDTPPGTRSSKLPRTARSTGVSSFATQQLAVIRSGRNSTERIRATIDLANSLAPSDFAAWLDGRWFDMPTGTELTIFTKLILERWKQEDPEGFIGWSLKPSSNSDASEALASLAEKNPQRVTSFFKLLPGRYQKIQILTALAKSHPALALQCLRDPGADFYSATGYSVAGIFEQLAKNAPAEVEAFIGELSGETKIRAEGMLIDAKMKTDYAGELRKLWDNPDGLEIYKNLQNKIPAKIFDERASLPPTWRAAIAANPNGFIGGDSSKWLTTDLVSLGFSEGQETAILNHSMLTSANTYPEVVLKMMTENEVSDYNRRRIIQMALFGKGPQAETLIALLTSDSDREIARSLLPPPAPSSTPVKAETPAQNKAPNPYTSIIRNMAPEQMAALGEEFKSMAGDQKRDLAEAIAKDRSENFSPALTGEAIRHITANPAESADPQLPRVAADYVNKLAAADPEACSEWIRSLPDGETKLWARLNLHLVWSRYDPKAAEQWFQTLPTATRTQVESLTRKPAN